MNIIFRHVGSIRPLKNKLYSDEINNFDIEIHHVLFWFVACKIYDATGGKLKS
jgi:hypothetical protein